MAIHPQNFHRNDTTTQGGADAVSILMVLFCENEKPDCFAAIRRGAAAQHTSRVSGQQLNRRSIPAMLKRSIPSVAVLLGQVFCLYTAQCNASEAPDRPPMVVYYPQVEDVHVRDFDAYFIKQLTLALDKADVAYRLNPRPTATFVESRSEYHLLNKRYSIHWLNSNAKREANLIPIRIPLFKGLIGWRLLFIKKGQQTRFTPVTSLTQLQSMTPGQGHDWPDTAILRANHFTVETSPKWDALFRMQAVGRMDFLPRSIIEIWREQRIFQHLNIEIEQTLALQYPAAYYFFTSKQNTKLAEVVAMGLMRAIEDGSFDRNFYAHFGEIIDRANLNQRRVIQLHNPLMTFPEDKRLWFHSQTAPQVGD